MVTATNTFVSAREAAAMLGISKCTLYRWIKRGWITGIALPNGTIRISLEELNEILTNKAY